MCDLAEWTRSHLELLFDSHGHAAFEKAYDSTFKTDAFVPYRQRGKSPPSLESGTKRNRPQTVAKEWRRLVATALGLSWKGTSRLEG